MLEKRILRIVFYHQPRNGKIQLNSLFFILLYGVTYAQIFKPYLEKDSMIFYKIPSSAIKPYCEFSPKAERGGWHGGIETVGPQTQTWLFRGPTDEDRCRTFMKVMSSIKSKNQIVTLMGYIPHRALVHFGAVRVGKECFEWFEGDCKKL